jgi:hypothetical protein
MLMKLGPRENECREVAIGAMGGIKSKGKISRTLQRVY